MALEYFSRAIFELCAFSPRHATMARVECGSHRRQAALSAPRHRLWQSPPALFTGAKSKCMLSQDNPEYVAAVLHGGTE